MARARLSSERANAHPLEEKVAGVLLLRPASTGYLLAAMMLVFTVALGPYLTVA